jgi:wyosine [tRNA(Phe)-imidazoG37] synthetase (radical SAM superfamily)
MTPPPHNLLVHRRHDRNWQGNRYVYPVISRRSRGLSIGVNLNPDKICNFDCIYCSVDRTQPPVIRTVDLGIVGEELEQMLSMVRSGQVFQHAPLDATPPQLRSLRDIAFSGDGEPTSFAGFRAACGLVADSLGRHHQTDVKIVLLTNATLLHRPAVRGALAFLDEHNGEIWAKLDAGTAAYYRRVDRTETDLDRVLGNIAEAGRIRPIVIQSLFMTIDGRGPDGAEIDAYVGRLGELVGQGCRIKLVQVYTVARRPAEACVGALSDDGLDQIARQVRAVGLAAETYGGC